MQAAPPLPARVHVSDTKGMWQPPVRDEPASVFGPPTPASQKISHAYKQSGARLNIGEWFKIIDAQQSQETEAASSVPVVDDTNTDAPVEAELSVSVVVPDELKARPVKRAKTVKTGKVKASTTVVNKDTSDF